jgi:hypothetical protein
VGKKENEMNLAPCIPKESFGRSRVGRDGVPKIHFRVFFVDNIEYIHKCIHYFTLHNLFYVINSDRSFIFRTTDVLNLM